MFRCTPSAYQSRGFVWLFGGMRTRFDCFFFFSKIIPERHIRNITVIRVPYDILPSFFHTVSPETRILMRRFENVVMIYFSTVLLQSRQSVRK